MPCNKCGEELIYYQTEFSCPKCNGYHTLEKNEGQEYTQRFQELARKRFVDYLRQFDKYQLIFELAYIREQYATDLFASTEYNAIQINVIFDYTFIILELLRFGNEKKKGQNITDEKLKELLRATEMVINVETAHSKVKAGRSTVVLKQRCDLNKLTLRNISEHIRICENEGYFKISETYRKRGILTTEEGLKMRDQIREETGRYDRTYRDFTSEEFISDCYEIIEMLFGALVRSKFYAEVFDIRNFSNVFKDPSELMKLVWLFPKNLNTNTTVSRNTFIMKSQNLLKINKNKLTRNLISSQKNHIFPLFIEVKTKTDKYIIISQKFAFFIYAILHAIITKNMFDQETSKRALHFESQEVKEEFEKNGYSYKYNFLTKEFQIDGLAVRGDICYVVECKAYAFHTLIEEEKREIEMRRDIKGIIDGFEYTTKNQVTTERKIVGLPEKVKYVNDNKKSLGLYGVRRVSGLIILRDPPLEPDYKGVKIISKDQIPYL